MLQQFEYCSRSAERCDRYFVVDFLKQHCYLEAETKQIFELNQMSKLSKYGNSSCNTSEGIKPKKCCFGLRNITFVSHISPYVCPLRKRFKFQRFFSQGFATGHNFDYNSRNFLAAEYWLGRLKTFMPHGLDDTTA